MQANYLHAGHDHSWAEHLLEPLEPMLPGGEKTVGFLGHLLADAGQIYLMLLAVSGVLCVVCVCMGMAMMQSLGRLQLVEKELTAMQTSYQTLAENLEDARVQSVFAVQKQPQTAEEQPEQKRSYTVESGDSLGFISRKFYGDSSGIRKIMEANGLANADMIFEGQTLLIP